MAFSEHWGEYQRAFHNDWSSNFDHFIRQEKDPEAGELKHIRSTECGYTLAIKIRKAKANRSKEG